MEWLLECNFCACWHQSPRLPRTALSCLLLGRGAVSLLPTKKATVAVRGIAGLGRTPHVRAEHQSDRDFVQVDAAESKHEVLRSKIEIRLKKRDPVSWPHLEKSQQKAAAKFADPSVPHLPSYPSSYNK